MTDSTVLSPRCQDSVNPNNVYNLIAPSCASESTNVCSRDRSRTLGTKWQIAVPPSQIAPNALIFRFVLQSAARDLSLSKSLAGCLRWRQKGEDVVDLLQVPQTKSAHYGNLQTCGNLWICAVCAAKITERRRLEIQELVDKVSNAGGSVALSSFTMQHNISEPLSEVLGGLQKASASFWSGKPYQTIKSKFGLVGKIRGLEITVGQKGWHPHFHPLLVFENGMTPELMFDLEQRCRERWLTRLKKVGRYANWENGFTLRWGDNAIAEYLAKLDKQIDNEFKTWTEAHELAKSANKTARRGGRTPNALLADCLQGDKQAGELWQEYAKALKGKRQLVWSDGLRERYNIAPEKSDKVLAKEQNEVSIILAQLDSEQWRAVLAHDIRGELLTAAKSGDAWLVLDFLEDFGINGVYYPTLLDDPYYSGDFQPGAGADRVQAEDILPSGKVLKVPELLT